MALDYLRWTSTKWNVEEYRVSLTHILPYKDKIFDFVLIRENTVSENPYSCIFYAVIFKNAESIHELCSSFYTHAESHCLGNHNNLALESQADTEKLSVKKVIWKFQKGMQCCLKSRQYSWKVSAKGSIFSKSQNFIFWIRIWEHRKGVHF